MNFFRNVSIQRKFLFITIFSCIPIYLLCSYFIVQQYRGNHRKAQRQLLTALESISSDHFSQVEGLKNLLVALSQDPEIRTKDPVRCSDLLNAILERSPSNLNVGIADVDGRVIATGIRQPLPIKYTVADRKYFQDALRTKMFAVGEYTVSRALKKPTPALHFSLPVLDERGKPLLVLYAAMDINRFCQAFDAQNLPQGTVLNLTDHRGVVLLRYPMPKIGPEAGATDRSDLRRYMTGAREKGVFFGITGLDGIRRDFAFKRLRLAPGQAPYLYMRVSIPEYVVTASSKKSFGISVLAALLATILSYLLISVTTRIYITSPIRKLVRTSEAVAKGDLSVKSELADTVDEIGLLARAFDAMTGSLESRLKQISLAESEKHRLAYYDPLTELPNRRMLKDRLNAALKRGSRQGTGVALLYIDLDNFKIVNDSLGHSAGDQLLTLVATRYMSMLRDNDLVCRLGGDEFAVILHDIRHDEEVTAVVERLLGVTADPLVLCGQEYAVTASIGVALYPRDAADASTLEKNSDLALYHAKDEGKNTFRMFSEELNRLSHERVSLGNALRQVLARDELLIHYQPKVCLENGKVTGVEALLRWDSPEFGMVLPGRFIPIAEENHSIIPIGEWVLRSACEQQVAWQREGLDLTVAVNLSAVQFKSPSLDKRIRHIIEETGVRPERVELELTESCLMNNPDATIRILEKLCRLKCRIAIDDFGTGYSSLSYLKNFPVAILKIDRSFIQDLTENPGDRAIAQSIVDLADNLNMATVAEGVELPGQQRILKEIGCGYIQGFLHYRPLPAQELAAILLRERAGEVVEVAGASDTDLLPAAT